MSSLFRIKWLFLFLALSCDSKKVKITKDKPIDIPSRIMRNAKIYFNEEGKEVVEAKGKLIEEYGFKDTAYTYFPKGIQLKFYDKNKPNPGKLFADKAKVIPLRQWYEAKGNVMIISSDGDTLKTSTIFWDKRKKLVWAPDTTVISKIDNSIIYANGGVEATDDLKNYTLKNDNGFAFPK